MLMLTLPEFTEVAAALQNLETKANTAETHGILCALFCGGAKINRQAWVDTLLSSFTEAEHKKAQGDSEALLRLFIATENYFKSDEFDLQLLLPADDQPLHKRIIALRDWCQGFLSGLNLLGVAFNKPQETEIQEVLDNLIKVSSLHYEPNDSVDAESEASYMELVEYTRMGIILLHSLKSTLFKRRAAAKPFDQKKP